MFHPLAPLSVIVWEFIGARALFIALAFSIIGGLSASKIAAQSALDGFDPNVNGTIRIIVVQPSDGKIIIGGDFTTVAPNGSAAVARNRIARFNPDGTLDAAFNPNANSIIFSIAVQSDGKILAGGEFTGIGGQPRNYIARLDAATGAADSFDPSADNFVYAIVIQSNDKILTGGSFTKIGGQARSRLARLDAANGAVDSFNPNANGSVFTIAIQSDGKILAGGFFTAIGGQARNYIARLDATGAADFFDPGANDTVYAIAIQSNGKILAGGSFTVIGGESRNRIARLDATSGAADAFNPNASNRVLAITVQADGKILAGGFFTNIGGEARNRLARLDGVTGWANSFNPNANDEVFSIAVQSDGKILAGGGFAAVSPNAGAAVTRNCLARFERDGLLDRTLNLSMVANFVAAVAIQPDGKIIIGGSFISVLGVPRNRIARLNADGTLDAAFDPNAGNDVFALAVQPDGKILAGGNFTSIGGQARNHLARLDGVTGAADSFDPNAGGFVMSITLQADGKILAGFFPTNSISIGGQTRRAFARLTNDTAALSALNVTRTTVTLTRSGSAAQFSRVVFEQSTDNGATFTTLGTATNSRFAPVAGAPNGRMLSPNAPQASSYTLSGLNLPTEQNVLIRARGFHRGGYYGGSETAEDKTQIAFLAAPTAASVSISGTVVIAQQLGLTNALVTLTDAEGNSRTIRTDKSGAFRFANVEAGATCILTVTSKRYAFAPRIVTANEDLEVNFTPNQ